MATAVKPKVRPGAPVAIKPRDNHIHITGAFGRKAELLPAAAPRRLPPMRFYASFTMGVKSCLMLCPTLESRDAFLAAAFEPKSKPIRAYNHSTKTFVSLASKDASIRAKVRKGWAQRLLKDDFLTVMHLS